MYYLCVATNGIGQPRTVLHRSVILKSLYSLCIFVFTNTKQTINTVRCQEYMNFNFFMYTLGFNFSENERLRNTFGFLFFFQRPLFCEIDELRYAATNLASWHWPEWFIMPRTKNNVRLWICIRYAAAHIVKIYTKKKRQKRHRLINVRVYYIFTQPWISVAVFSEE